MSEPKRLSTRVFNIPSGKDPNKTYKVFQYTDGSWECECPGFQYRKSCSHIEKAKEIV